VAQLSGASYYRARYYDPTTGRFLSEDPVGFSAGVDFYRYVANNPVLYSDPLGLGPANACKPGDPCKVYGQLHRLDLQFLCENLPHSPKANCVRTCLLNFFGPGNSGLGLYSDPPVYWGPASGLLAGFQRAYGPIVHLSCFEVCHWP
jgi:hypothetical protein